MSKAKKTSGKKPAKSDGKPVSAAEMKKLESEAKKDSKPEPVVIPALKRTIQEVVAERVTIAPGSIGLALSDDTTIEESLAILDWTTSLNDHVGFMIGDVLNFSAVKWGDKYKQALDQTGRALSTLKGYAEAARRIPVEKRISSLSFSHHRELIRLPDEKMAEVLKDLEKESNKKDGAVPTRDQLRIKVQHSMPRKRKSKGKATSGKHGKGKKKTVELPPYQPTEAEQEKLDEAFMAIEETAKLLNPDGKVFKVVIQLDNKDKQRWLSKLDPIVLFFKGVTDKTGY